MAKNAKYTVVRKSRQSGKLSQVEDGGVIALIPIALKSSGILGVFLSVAVTCWHKMIKCWGKLHLSEHTLCIKLTFLP